MGFTSFEFVGVSVVSNVRRLWFGDLHLTIFLGFSEGKVLLVPLQTRAVKSADNVTL